MRPSIFLAALAGISATLLAGRLAYQRWRARTAATMQDAEVGIPDHPTKCPVRLAGDVCCRAATFVDKLRRYAFDDFPSLARLMTTDVRLKLLQRDEAVLTRVREEFKAVVAEALAAGLYSSALAGRRWQLQHHGSATVRDGKGSLYADYLHNDAWFGGTTRTLALINVWLVLNESPPANHLAFHETDAAKTSCTHMLKARFEETRGATLVYDGGMCWGKFYCFVSGQRSTSERVLLHGAIDVPNAPPLPRASVEMRFAVEPMET